MILIGGYMVGTISKTPDTVVVRITREIEVNKDNVFLKINDRSIAQELIRTEEGLEFLAGTRNEFGQNALREVVWRHESIALELTGTEEGRRRLAEAKDKDGLSALDVAIGVHDSVKKIMLKRGITLRK
jgi:hypothetical protein